MSEHKVYRALVVLVALTMGVVSAPEQAGAQEVEALRLVAPALGAQASPRSKLTVAEVEDLELQLALKVPLPDAEMNRALDDVMGVDAVLGQLAQLVPGAARVLAHLGWGPAARIADRIQWDWPMPSREPAVWTYAEGDMSQPVVGTPRLDALTHVMRPGQGVYGLMSRYEISREALEELNPDVDLNTLTPGQEILVWQRDFERVPRSSGSPNRGRVLDSEPLPPGDNYVILYQHRAFGTFYAVSEIIRVMRSYRVAFPEAEPIIIGDLSFRGGGKIRPHVSHQSGRDVDITYPRRDDAPDFRRFHPIRLHNLDTTRTLWLFKEFVASGMVEYIFVDWPVQRRLYEEAVRRGAPAAWLKEVFEYPHPGSRGIVRVGGKGHDDHFHVRFHCQPSDRWCR